MNDNKPRYVSIVFDRPLKHEANSSFHSYRFNRKNQKHNNITILKMIIPIIFKNILQRKCSSRCLRLR